MNDQNLGGINGADPLAANAPGAAAAPLYLQSALDAYPQGVVLDFRVRIALDLLKSSPRYAAQPHADGPEAWAPDEVVQDALAVADELVSQGAAAGWVRPLPPDAELAPAVRAQAERIAAFEFHKQTAFNQQIEAAQSRVARPANLAN